MEKLAETSIGEEAAGIPQLPSERPNGEIEEVVGASTAEKDNSAIYSPPTKRARHQEPDSSIETTKESPAPLDPKNFYTQKFYPPTLRPADKLISIVDLEILAGYLIFYWGPAQFDTYYKLRDSGLYERAWEMLEYAAEDMIKRKLSRRNEENSPYSQLQEAISHAPVIPSPLNELQDMVTEFQWRNSTLASTAAAAAATSQASSDDIESDVQNGFEEPEIPAFTYLSKINKRRFFRKRRTRARRTARYYSTDSDSD